MYSYNGGTTGTDAVWAGVPILTLPLNKFAARLEGWETAARGNGAARRGGGLQCIACEMWF